MILTGQGQKSDMLSCHTAVMCSSVKNCELVSIQRAWRFHYKIQLRGRVSQVTCHWEVEGLKSLAASFSFAGALSLVVMASLILRRSRGVSIQVSDVLGCQKDVKRGKYL